MATVAEVAIVAADAVEIEAEERRNAKEEAKEEHRRLVKKRIGVCRLDSVSNALLQALFKTESVTCVTTLASQTHT